MKKVLLLSIIFISCLSCSKDSNIPPLKLSRAPIESLAVPDSFEFGKTYQLTITYNLPSSCYNFFDVDYEYDGTERNINVIIYEDSEAICPQVTVKSNRNILVRVTQYEDYTFNIWKGKDNLGQDIIESIVVPVTN